MTPSQNHLLSILKDRRLHVLLVVLLVAVVYLISSKPDKNRLVLKVNSQIREEKFDEIYDEAWDNLHLNVTKEEFIRRMKVAVSKLRTIDADLNFQRDSEWEQMMNFNREERYAMSAYQKLEKDGKSVLVSFWWNGKGEFMDISVMATGETSKEYNVYGVSYQHLYMDGQIIY